LRKFAEIRIAEVLVNALCGQVLPSSLPSAFAICRFLIFSCFSFLASFVKRSSHKGFHLEILRSVKNVNMY
jgi:hypothetical protein